MSPTDKTQDLIVTREGGVTHITLDRSEKANALSADLVEHLIQALETAATDGSRLLVLSGAGKHFCAGFDFGDFEALSDGDLALRFLRMEHLLQTLAYLPVPSLALARGKVFGAGADLVASCTMRIAAPGASFLMPGPRFGIILGTARLARRIGADAARAIQIANRMFDAEEALKLGFLTDILPEHDWETRLDHEAGQASTLDPETVSSLLTVTDDAGRDAEMAALARSVMRPGLKDRIRAFREAGKR